MKVIKVQYQQFMSYGFSQALQKLAAQNFPAQTAYAIKKLTDDMQKWRKQIQGEYLKLVGDYAKKDEKGEIVHPEPEDANSFDVDPDKMEAYKAAEKEFGAKEVVIDRKPILLAQLGNVQFTPAELSVLDPLLSEDGPVAPVVGQIGSQPA